MPRPAMLPALTFALLAFAAQAGNPCAAVGVAPVRADVTTALAALPAAAPATSPALDPGRLASLSQEILRLQKGGTDADEERRIVAILAELEPLARAALLRSIDQGRDHYDLRHLVYEDVDDADRRARLLSLIDEAGEALTQAGAHEIGVISDIDDTVAPLHGGDSFPGAGAVYHALERGPDGQGQDGDIHWVTARPPLVMGDVRARLDRAGVPQGTIDNGDLLGAIFRGEDGYEDEKVRDIERQLRLHPGQRFVLIGDDTQRDPAVYRRILAAHPDRVAGVFIHRVARGPIDRTRYPAEQFYFFDSYDQARGEMAARGLIATESP